MEDWSAWLAQSDEDELTAHIRQQTHIGRPCGNEDFLEYVEWLLNRAVRHAKRGRKPKKPGQQDAAHE